MTDEDRLTAHNEAGQGIINMNGVSDELEARERIRRFSPLIISKLTEYEDTGLSPDEVNELKAENAALRERLEKAVEHGKYFIIEEPRNGKIYYSILRHKVINNYICTELTRAEAEARLAELKGGAK